MPAALAPVAPRPVAPAVHIGVYDGPLDLLLFLVRREGVDVRSIPVARICDAYLAMLRDSDVVDVDDAGDYLLMAATLCQLKARDLLPRAPGPSDEEVEEEDPRERLQRRLQCVIGKCGPGEMADLADQMFGDSLRGLIGAHVCSAPGG